MKKKTTIKKKPKATTNRMTAVQKRQTIKRHQSGESAASIARAFGFSAQAILNLITKYKKEGDSCLLAYPGSGLGRPKVPTMTDADKKPLRDILLNKSPHQMKFPDGSKDIGKWTNKEVRALLLANTGKKINLGDCNKFLKELNLTPVVHRRDGSYEDSVRANWKNWISDDFTYWKKEHCPKTLKRRETNATRAAKIRSRKKRSGPPFLEERISLALIKKYLLNDPMLKTPDTLAEHFSKIATKHSKKA